MNSEKPLYYFREISKIPRVSRHCERIADYLESFAKSRGLWYRRDASNNVIIVKDAAAGRENDPAVMLQGHVDMVGEKTADSTHDFLCDPITIIEDGDTMRADGTTLGADNGTAVAIMLALLDEKELDAPRLECVFTTDEEIGMLGAVDISLEGMQAAYMINADSEDDGVFTCGCCGGASLDFDIPVERDCAGYKGGIKVTLSGLRGGHSGAEIHTGRLNAVKLTAELLEPQYGIVSMERDGKDNAIPDRCEATVLSGADEIKKAFLEKSVAWKKAEPGITLTIEEADSCGAPLSYNSAKKVLNFLRAIPYGVQKMCTEPAGLVHTSDNIGILLTNDTSVTGTISVRSVSEADRDALCGCITDLCKEAGGSTRIHGQYPGWEYKKDSKLREVMCNTWKEMFGRAPTVDVIHAGLECGVLLSKKPDLDIVSMGPQLHGIHTPAETMSISSLKKCTDFIVRVLEVLK